MDSQKRKSTVQAAGQPVNIPCQSRPGAPPALDERAFVSLVFNGLLREPDGEDYSSGGGLKRT
jgi:hypothetical protein